MKLFWEKHNIDDTSWKINNIKKIIKKYKKKI